jgi:hypothetical protein
MCSESTRSFALSWTDRPDTIATFLHTGAKALSCDEYIVGSWSEGKFKPTFSAKLDHPVADHPNHEQNKCLRNRSTIERVRDVANKFAHYWGRLLRTNYGKAPEQHTEQS